METDQELKNIDDKQLKEAYMVVDDENNLVGIEIQEVDGLFVDMDEEKNLVATTDKYFCTDQLILSQFSLAMLLLRL
nr:hypothetical protein [Tanacetum cinerariifolium]